MASLGYEEHDRYRYEYRSKAISRPPEPRPDWQLREYFAACRDESRERVERVTRLDEQFSYNPRTKRGRELLANLAQTCQPSRETEEAELR